MIFFIAIIDKDQLHKTLFKFIHPALDFIFRLNKNHSKGFSANKKRFFGCQNYNYFKTKKKLNWNNYFIYGNNATSNFFSLNIAHQLFPRFNSCQIFGKLNVKTQLILAAKDINVYSDAKMFFYFFACSSTFTNQNY